MLPILCRMNCILTLFGIYLTHWKIPSCPNTLDINTVCSLVTVSFLLLIKQAVFIFMISSWCQNFGVGRTF